MCVRGGDFTLPHDSPQLPMSDAMIMANHGYSLTMPDHA